MAGALVAPQASIVPRPEKLHHLGRAFGLLASIRPAEDCIIACIGRREIVLPPAVEQDLRHLIGCKIGVVRIEEKYLFRRCC